MIAISLLRDKIVIRIVLEIKKTATKSKSKLITKPQRWIAATALNNFLAEAPPYRVSYTYCNFLAFLATLIVSAGEFVSTIKIS